MSNIFICSDHHFGHEKTCSVFKRSDGTPLRPFANAEEMNEEMIKRHNAMVRPHDKCYFLGDVVINKKFLPLLNELHGKRKILIKGNHDIFDLDLYSQFFADIRSYHVMSGLILSHIPIHKESMDRFGVNCHGHLHANIINDPFYVNCSMEQLNYTPISLDELRNRIKKNQESFENTGKVINWSSES